MGKGTGLQGQHQMTGITNAACSLHNRQRLTGKETCTLHYLQVHPRTHTGISVPLCSLLEISGSHLEGNPSWAFGRAYMKQDKSFGTSGTALK